MNFVLRLSCQLVLNFFFLLSENVLIFLFCPETSHYRIIQKTHIFKGENPLTRKSGEVNRECVKQPLVGLWAEGSCVGGIRVQVGQLYPARVTWQNASGLRVRFPHRVVLEFIITAACAQERTPLQYSTVGHQVNHA